MLLVVEDSEVSCIHVCLYMKCIDSYYALHTCHTVFHTEGGVPWDLSLTQIPPLKLSNSTVYFVLVSQPSGIRSSSAYHKMYETLLILEVLVVIMVCILYLLCRGIEGKNKSVRLANELYMYMYAFITVAVSQPYYMCLVG